MSSAYLSRISSWPFHLYLHVSTDEEHSSVALGDGTGRRTDLGERAHHYCLLTLARQRLADARRGIDPDSQGWVDTAALSKMLGLDTAHLNIQVHRLRRQFALAMPAGVNDTVPVERRRGQLRLASIGFSIVRGSRLEGGVSTDLTGLVAEFGFEPVDLGGLVAGGRVQ